MTFHGVGMDFFWNYTFMVCTICNKTFCVIAVFLYQATVTSEQSQNTVFLSKLLLLFQFCHFCRSGNKPDVTETQIGTEVVIKAVCTNQGCRKEFSWSSQSVMPGTKIPAGNFLICMAVVFAGGSFSKVHQIFQHMGLACVSLNTFFKHQRVRVWIKY